MAPAATFSLAAALLIGLLPAQARAQGGPDLLARYQSLQPALARSPFERPLILQSGSSSDAPHGDVYAVINHPFAAVAAELRHADNWCELLILPFNVKRCVSSGTPERQALQLAVGRKSEQPIQDAYQVSFDYALRVAEPDYLSVRMTAAIGPLGTRDYRLNFEAIPLPGGRSFVHLSYAYAVGLAARLATQAYLATVGRDKVGFSLVDADADGRGDPVGGIQGVAERNTMRYFLAVEAFLKAPEDSQTEQRLHDWFAATERYPQQLREMGLDSYLVMKRRELQAQRRQLAQASSNAAKPPKIMR